MPPAEPREEDDLAIVAGVIAREPGAAGRMWDRYAPLVRRILLDRAGDGFPSTPFPITGFVIPRIARPILRVDVAPHHLME